MTDIMDAMLRAQAEAVYMRRLTDAEWAEKRLHRSHALDRQIAGAIARTALERAAACAEKIQNQWGVHPMEIVASNMIADDIRSMMTEIERKSNEP